MFTVKQIWALKMRMFKICLTPLAYQGIQVIAIDLSYGQIHILFDQIFTGIGVVIF